MKLKNFNLLHWVGRIFFISFLGMIIAYNSNSYKFLFDYFVVLFNLNFILIGIGLFRPRGDINYITSNILAVSLILAGLAFSTAWVMVAMFSFPLNNLIVTSIGAVFIVSVFGIMFGGLASK